MVGGPLDPNIQGVSKNKWDLGFRLVLRCSEVSDQKSFLSLTPIKIWFYFLGQVFSLIWVVWKEIFVWYNAAMTEKSTQILKIFFDIVIDTNCLLLSSSSNQSEIMSYQVKFNFNGGQPSKLFWSETSEPLKTSLKPKYHFFKRPCRMFPHIDKSLMKRFRSLPL